jgi:hypothetical protein
MRFARHASGIKEMSQIEEDSKASAYKEGDKKRLGTSECSEQIHKSHHIYCGSQTTEGDVPHEE